MSSQGPNSPGTAADDAGFDPNGVKSWTTPSNALTENGTSTTCITGGAQAWSHGLKLTNFGFSIPAGATINGILVEIKRSASRANAIIDSQVQLVGVAGAVDKADTLTHYPTSLTYASYGGSSDTWGASPTDSDINSSGFGVEISIFNDNGLSTTTNIDYARITVSYTGGGGQDTPELRQQSRIQMHQLLAH
jgi:hypothetical protein